MAEDHCATISAEVARPSKVSTGVWRVRGQGWRVKGILQSVKAVC